MKHSLTKKLVTFSILLSILLMGSWVGWCLQDTRQALFSQKKSDVQVLSARTADYVKLYAQGLNAGILSLAGTIESDGRNENVLPALNSFQNSNPGKVLSVACVLLDGSSWCTRSAAMEIFGNEYFTQFVGLATSTHYKGIQWSEPYVSPLTLERTVALFKPVQLGNKAGAVIIEIDLGTMLSSLLQTANDTSLVWAVVSKNNQLVATSDDYTLVSSNYKQISRKTLENDIVRLMSLPVGTDSCKIENVSYLFFRRATTCMDWTILAFARRETLSLAIRPLLVRTVFVGVVHLLLLTLFLFLIARNFTRPIVKMTEKISKSDTLISLDFPEVANRRDEIGVLARSMTQMIDRTKALSEEREKILEQQRVLEIDVLQGQIHPHFLGNTLTCIQSLVKEGEKAEALSAITYLVRLLNYSISRTDEKAVLEEELNCVKAYTALRQMRASYPFDYQIFVPSSHLHHPVPRLILQPIIENAIVHGFAGLDRKGTITITSYTLNNKLYLCIDDNGLGAPINRLNDVAHGNVAPSAHAHGIGVQNVFKRLALNDPGKNNSAISLNDEGGVRVILDLGPFFIAPPAV